jgi:hypothetical protein
MHIIIIRINLYKQLNNTYDFFKDNLSSTQNTMREQLLAINIVEEELKNSALKLESLKTRLLGVVVTRDNIGEALWYTYTAVLLISIVQYNLSARGCVMDPKTMSENHQKFVDAEDAKLKQNAKASSQIYAS